MIFKIENEAMSRAVQNKCFKIGGRWQDDNDKRNNLFLDINWLNIRIENLVMSLVCHQYKFDDVYAFLGDADGWIENTGEMIPPGDMMVELEDGYGCNYGPALRAADVNWEKGGWKIWRPHREKDVKPTASMMPVEENTAPGFWEKIEMYEKQIRALKEKVSALEYAIRQASIANRSLRAENQELRSKGDVNRAVMEKFRL